MTFGPYDDPPTDVADGGDVVLGLMPLAHALPTAWGRFLRDRLRHPYETWLEAVLGDPPADWPTVNAFWQRHHYDVLVARWANAVGADRLVVTVGTAEAPAPCLTAAGAETVRRVHLAFHHREQPVERYREVVPAAVVPALIAAHRAGIALDWNRAAARDLSGRDLPAALIEDAVVAVLALIVLRNSSGNPENALPYA